MQKRVSRRENLLGKKFGKLTVQNFIGNNKYRCAEWLCKCECGNETIATTSHLNGKNSLSCGCEWGNKTHGLSHSRIWIIYINIQQRCNNKKSNDYKNYGGRGIKCMWKTFEEFYQDMKDGYDDKMTIDRIDNNGNYCKENCRWAMKGVQANNTRRNIYLTYNNKKQSVAQWAREYGLGYWTLLHRIQNGWSTKRTLNTKTLNRGQINHKICL